MSVSGRTQMQKGIQWSVTDMAQRNGERLDVILRRNRSVAEMLVSSLIFLRLYRPGNSVPYLRSTKRLYAILFNCILFEPTVVSFVGFTFISGTIGYRLNLSLFSIIFADGWLYYNIRLHTAKRRTKTDRVSGIEMIDVWALRGNDETAAKPSPTSEL